MTSSTPSCCGCELVVAGHVQHNDDCEVLAAHVNRVAAFRSAVLGGVFQNPELLLTDFAPPGGPS